MRERQRNAPKPPPGNGAFRWRSRTTGFLAGEEPAPVRSVVPGRRVRLAGCRARAALRGPAPWGARHVAAAGTGPGRRPPAVRRRLVRRPGLPRLLRGPEGRALLRPA